VNSVEFFLDGSVNSLRNEDDLTPLCVGFFYFGLTNIVITISDVCRLSNDALDD
jgi:hypothetical protein